MNYKILETHVTFANFEQNVPCKVCVAIQSDPTEKTPTHFKAYCKEFTSPSHFDFVEALFDVAANGSKLSKEDAAESFPQLKHLGYY